MLDVVCCGVLRVLLMHNLRQPTATHATSTKRRCVRVRLWRSNTFSAIGSGGGHTNSQLACGRLGFRSGGPVLFLCLSLLCVVIELHRRRAYGVTRTIQDVTGLTMRQNNIQHIVGGECGCGLLGLLGFALLEFVRWVSQRFLDTAVLPCGAAGATLEISCLLPCCSAAPLAPSYKSAVCLFCYGVCVRLRPCVCTALVVNWLNRRRVAPGGDCRNRWRVPGLPICQSTSANTTSTHTHKQVVGFLSWHGKAFDTAIVTNT